MNAGTRAQELIDLIADEASGFDDIGRKIIARRIMGMLRGWLPEEKARCELSIAGLTPFTDPEAMAFGRETIPFGKHAGTRYDDVPIEYLIWLADESRRTWRSLHRYLNSKRILGERMDD